MQPHPSERPDPNFRRNWVGFFLLGLSNVLPYAMISAAANSLAKSFHKQGFVATVYGAAGSTTIIVKMMNTLVLTKVPYNIRFSINIFVLLLGIAGIAFAPNFIVAIFGVVIIGTARAFGENLALGYIARFDGRLVNAWSCGAGCGGLLGACFIIAVGCAVRLTTITKEDLLDIKWYGFLGCSPIVLLYAVAYFAVIREPARDATPMHNHPRPVNGHSINAADPCYSDDETRPLVSGVETAEVEGRCYAINEGEHYRQLASNSDPSASTSPTDSIFSEARRLRWWRSFKLIWKLGANLALANFATYVCRVSAAKTFDNTKYDEECPEPYASLQLCFMAAQFASMSSVQHIRIRRVEILMAIQLCNAVVWGLDIVFKFMPVYILPSYMVIVGLLMGAIYVNTFYAVHNDGVYHSEDRDLLANMTSTFLTVGVAACSILMTVLYKTVLVDY